MTSELGKALAARPGQFDRFSETLRWVGWMRFRYPDSRLVGSLLSPDIAVQRVPAPKPVKQCLERKRWGP